MKNDDALIHFDGDALESALLADPNGDVAYGNYGAARRLRVGRFWRAVRTRIWSIAAFTLAATLLAAMYEAQQRPYYRATARIEINPDSSPAFGVSNGGASAGSYYDPFYFSSQLQIVEGSGLLRRVAKATDLEHDRAFLDPFHGDNPSVLENMKRMVGLSRAPQSDDQRRVPAPDRKPAFDAAPPVSGAVVDQSEIERLAPYVSMIRSGLSVSPVKEKRLNVKDTRLVDISFTHYDRNVAASIANAIADNYVAANLEKKTGKSVATGEFLKKRVAELQVEIRAGEQRLIAYAKNNQIVSLDANQNTVVQRLADLNVKLSQAEYDRIMAESAVRSAGAPGAAAAEVESNNAGMAALEARLNELRQRREQLLVELREQAPEVIEVERQIAQAEKDLEETRQRAIATLSATLETKFREAGAREAELRKAFERQRNEVLSQNQASINYRIIQQEAETNKGMLEGLLQRLRENDVVVSGTPNNVSVVDRALAPGAPSGPERLQYIALAFLLSLAAAVGLALLRGRSDDSLITPEEVETGLLLPVLSEIPSAAHASRRLLPSMLRRHGDGREPAGVTPDLEHYTAAKEAYLHLRTNVLMATTQRPPGALLVASGRPGEGKTTTAVNLAKVLAETGARVVLVDADLRNPSLGRAFGLENGVGLSTLLAGERVTADGIKEAIKFDPASRVYVLTSGPQPDNPATLLCSARMRQLVSFLRNHFAYIVVDSPPALLFTDASVLSTLVDAVLLVVRSGQSSQDVAARARKMLQDRGAQMFGVVLNDTARPTSAYGYDGRKTYAAAGS